MYNGMLKNIFYEHFQVFRWSSNAAWKIYLIMFEPHNIKITF